MSVSVPPPPELFESEGNANLGCLAICWTFSSNKMYNYNCKYIL